MSAGSVEAVTSLADFLSLHRMQFDRLQGITPVVDAYLRADPTLEKRIQSEEKLGLYGLEKLIPPPPSTGVLQQASLKDIELSLAWDKAFHDDCKMPRQSEEERRRILETSIGKNKVYFWVVDGEKVASAMLGRELPGGRSIGFVYTPEKLRGRGYGKQVAAHTTKVALDNGASYTCLFAQLENQTSNKIYRDIGYVWLENLRCLHFRSPQAADRSED